jgi:hypothetical protein
VRKVLNGGISAQTKETFLSGAVQQKEGSLWRFQILLIIKSDTDNIPQFSEKMGT